MRLVTVESTDAAGSWKLSLHRRLSVVPCVDTIASSVLIGALGAAVRRQPGAARSPRPGDGSLPVDGLVEIAGTVMPFADAASVPGGEESAVPTFDPVVRAHEIPLLPDVGDGGTSRRATLIVDRDAATARAREAAERLDRLQSDPDGTIELAEARAAVAEADHVLQEAEAALAALRDASEGDDVSEVDIGTELDRVRAVVDAATLAAARRLGGDRARERLAEAQERERELHDRLASSKGLVPDGPVPTHLAPPDPEAVARAQRAADEAYAGQRAARRAVRTLLERMPVSDDDHRAAVSVLVDEVHAARAEAEAIDDLLAGRGGDAAPGSAAAADLARAAGLDDVEWYLLTRLAAQRRSDVRGSCPLILDDPLRSLAPGEIATVLGRVVRMTEAVQVVVVSDDPALRTWADAMGADVAAVCEIRRATSP